MGRAPLLVARLARLGGLAAVAATVLVPVPATPASASVAVLAISGRGWGHGVGMAQDGALEMGRRGFSLGQILGQFYPGTSIGRATGSVRVPLVDAGAAPTSATVTFPDGGQVVDTLSGQQSPGFPRAIPPGGTVTFTWDGARYSMTGPGAGAGGAGGGGARSGVAAAASAAAVPAPPPTLLPLPLPTPPQRTTTTTAAPRRTTTTTAPSSTPAPATSPPASPAPPGTGGANPSLGSSRPLWAIPAGGGALGVPARGRSYRGDLEADGSTGHLRLVNQLDVETYLTGMGEVLNPSWPPAALETQEIAARTYALRAMAAGGELCDDQRCQVYLGTGGEYAAAAQAVRATAGEVLVYGGQLVDAVYSANAGGYSATQEEGFGSGDSMPYLRAAPYPTGDTMAWTTSVGATDAAAALGIPGAITGASVASRGPSGRALTVSIAAGTAQVTVSGVAFAAALGLRSTLFDVRMTSAAADPPAPKPAASALQVPPDQLALLRRSPGDGLEGTGPGGAAGRVGGATVLAPRSGSHTGGVPWLLAVLAGVLVVLAGAGSVRQAGARRRSVAGGSMTRDRAR